MSNLSVICSAILFLFGDEPATPCQGLGDIVLDGQVDTADFVQFSACLDGPGANKAPEKCSPADGNADGRIDLHDFALFSNSFENTYFLYGPVREDREAEILALDISGELRAPDDLYWRIHDDLQRVEAAYPETAGVEHRPSYNHRRLIVGLDADAMVAIIESLNRYYQAKIIWSSDDLHGVSFCDNLNLQVVSSVYEGIQGVDHAYPSHYIGGADQIQIAFLNGFARYTLVDAWGDCPAGCSCARVWVIDVEDTGSLALVSDTSYGDGCD